MTDPRVIAAFKPGAKVEKGDATTQAVREINARTSAERDAKTARLRALRLARDAETAAATPAEAPKPKAARTRARRP